MPPSMDELDVHWMNLMKNQITQKFRSLEILKERLIFVNHLIKKNVQWVQNV